MPQSKIDTGEIRCGFLVRKDYHSDIKYDTTYREVTIKRRVKKIGDGAEDYIIEEFEEVTETPIKEVLAKEAEGVGIEAYMKPYEMAGLPLPGVVVSDEVSDFSGFPEDPADVIKVGDAAQKAFAGLDPDLRGDSANIEDFLNSLSKERIDAYIASKIKNVEKVEEKKNEGN